MSPSFVLRKGGGGNRILILEEESKNKCSLYAKPKGGAEGAQTGAVSIRRKKNRQGSAHGVIDIVRKRLYFILILSLSAEKRGDGSKHNRTRKKRGRRKKEKNSTLRGKRTKNAAEQDVRLLTREERKGSTIRTMRYAYCLRKKKKERGWHMTGRERRAGRGERKWGDGGGGRGSIFAKGKKRTLRENPLVKKRASLVSLTTVEEGKRMEKSEGRLTTMVGAEKRRT